MDADGAARNWMRAAAPGIATRRVPRHESSPIGRKARPSSRRWIAVLAIVVAIAGASTFASGFYLHAKAELAQRLLHAAWNESLRSGAPIKPWPWADTYPVAHLIAPGHDADVLVLAGASGRTLAFGPGHLDGSAMPGDAGNAVITAHRDTHFRFLRTVAPGDDLVVERKDGTWRHFRVRSAYVIDHRELRLPRDGAVPTLTLVTCYPFDAVQPGGPLRYVVVAEAA
ncbi:MAG: class GN sortase [Burkholderiales bacterium]